MLKKRILEDRGVVRVTFELPADVQGETVHLVGDFTSWKGVPMEKVNNGKWQATLDLDPGRSFEFRYLIDGARWENDWAADQYVSNPFGHENSVIETPPLKSARRSDQPVAEARRTAPKKAAAKKGVAKKAETKKTTKKEPAKKAATKKPAKKKPGGNTDGS
jgi:1,4-alpha-glucan branching enzyme